MGKELGNIPEKEPGAYYSQTMAKTAVLADPNFGIAYVLARVIKEHPYTDYKLPRTLEEFEFSIKGIMRFEMLQNDDLRQFRRLLGSSFTRKKSREKLTWRSRILISAFDSLASVEAFLEQDPLLRWPGSPHFSFTSAAALMPEGWFVLFQVQDVDLPDSLRLTDVLIDYIQFSEVFALVAHQYLLSPVGGGMTK